MTAGLTIFNDSGTVQIDESWRNYGFRQRVPVGISVSSVDGFANYTLSVPGEAVLVACRATVLRPVPLHSYFDGSTWTFNWRFYGEFIGVGYSETVEFFVFDVLPDSGFSTVGLEVFDAAGKRVFHSDMVPMRIPSGGIVGAASSFSGEGGRIYAPLILRNPIYGEFYSGIGFRHSTFTLHCTGSQIISSNRSLNTAAFGPSPMTGLYAAVDVTGLS